MELKTATEVEAQKCRLALASLAQMCVDAAEFPENIDRLYAWGQYLELGGRFSEAEVQGQFGIYGSCAALQILASDRFVEYGEYIRGGLLALPLISDSATADADQKKIHEYYEAKGDLATTYKLAALHDLASLVKSLDGENEFKTDPPAVAAKLALLARPGGGWPDCSLGETGRYQAANCHATAVALFSLSRAPSSLSKDCQLACSNAVEWLSSQPLQEQSVATLSLLVVALERLHAAGEVKPAALSNLLRDCRKELSGWVNSTTASEVMRSLEGMDYLTPDQPDPHRGKPFQFLFYLPHCLASIAILSSPTLLLRYEHRQFVRDVVSLLAKRISDTGKFVAAGRQMVSTVESLWIARLLNLYLSTIFYTGQLRRVLDSLRRRRLVGILIFAAVIVVGVPITVVFTEGIVQGILGVFSSIIVGFVTGVVASLVVDWAKRQ